MVSAIITTYKRDADIVERALKSILNQTYDDIEIIIVDDSPETYKKRHEVAERIQRYKEKGVIYIPHKINQGACAARNTGIKQAKGEYIAFLDDDDEWIKDKIEKQLEKFMSCSDDTALVYCGNIVVNDLKQEYIEAKTEFRKGYVFDELIKKNFIGSTSFPMIKTACLREVGGFDEDMPSAQDFDVWLKLASRYRIDYVNEPLVRYHIHDGDCISKSPEKKIIALERINKKYASYLDLHKNAKWRRQMSLVFRYSEKGDYFAALKCWITSAILQPLEIWENFKYLYWAIDRAKFRRK